MNPLPHLNIRVITTPDKADCHPMICIDNDDISYSRIVGMYTSGDGVGLQSNYDDDKDIMRLCDRIAMAVREFYLSHLPVDETISAPPTFFDGEERI